MCERVVFGEDMIDSFTQQILLSATTSHRLLKQVAGDDAWRSIGDTLARELERAFLLVEGALSERSL